MPTHTKQTLTRAGTVWTRDSAEAHKLRKATAAAMHTFRQLRPFFLALARRGMAQDLPWDNAAEAYEQVAERVEGGGAPGSPRPSHTAAIYRHAG